MKLHKQASTTSIRSTKSNRSNKSHRSNKSGRSEDSDERGTMRKIGHGKPTGHRSAVHRGSVGSVHYSSGSGSELGDISEEDFLGDVYVPPDTT